MCYFYATLIFVCRFALRANGMQLVKRGGDTGTYHLSIVVVMCCWFDENIRTVR